MRKSLFLAGATLLVIGSQAIQAAPFPVFFPCAPAHGTQCAVQLVHGNGNKARIDQDTTTFGFQFGFATQDGDTNRSYIGQHGSNEAAATSQNGNNNASYTYQAGNHQVSVTTQDGNGLWGGTSSIGGPTTTTISQTN